jgi:metal-responsive CopG/Arc/MetJ family transcriptional regulator
MVMPRTNVVLPANLLDAVDAEAQRAGMSRSAFVRTALDQYLDLRRQIREKAETRRRMEEACKQMDALAEKLGDWDPVTIIRRFRNGGWQDSP